MGHENAGGSSTSPAPDPQLCLVARIPLPSMPHSGEQVSLTALLQHGCVCRPHGLVERCPLANGRPAHKKKKSLEKVRLGVLASVGDRKRQIDASVSHFGR